MLQAIGGPVPPNTDHAVSVSLPTWKATVGYEEGEEWVVSKMECGYPRFFVHPSIRRLCREIIRRYGDPEVEEIMPFPSSKTAGVCRSFLISKMSREDAGKVRIVGFLPSGTAGTDGSSHITSKLSCVIFPKECAGVAKQVWQHTGDGISSRRSEFCFDAMRDGYLVEDSQSRLADETTPRFCKGPRRYRRGDSLNGITREGSLPAPANPNPQSEGADLSDRKEYAQFVEERFGRNLSINLALSAKLAVRRRITGDDELSEAFAKTSSRRRVAGLTEDDVFLYPTGMSSIFHAHQNLLATLGPMKSICFGFPYVDTLKILQKWGPGCLFYGYGSAEDIDDLEQRLSHGERFLSLFTELPGNPLLKSPDLSRIHALAHRYDFAIVIDDTVGTFGNVNVLPYADVVVSSLTKIFSGDSNVMGGSVVINPQSRFYGDLKKTFSLEYEDNLWAEDAIFLERNSRYFVSRIAKTNENAQAITQILKSSPLVKEVYYPMYSSTKPFYELCRTSEGGYGGLFSITFHSTAEAIAFFDALEVFKGPSLGTNFTLSCPYTILAHYQELQWTTSVGVPSDLIRISVGLENPKDLSARIQKALDAAQTLSSKNQG